VMIDTHSWLLVGLIALLAGLVLIKIGAQP
jgi:uncharacterized membrane protein